MNRITILFEHWPDKALFPNKAGNTLHWAQRSALRKAHREEAFWLAIKENSYFKQATIEIQVTAKDKRKRDLDGLLTACKPWIDGIVDAGIMEDDNYFCVPEISIRFMGVSAESVSLIITEIA